jgi:hypothetical protein
LNFEGLHIVALSKQNKLISTATIKFEVDSIANCCDDREFFTSILEIALPEFYNPVMRVCWYENIFIRSITVFPFFAWF